MEALYLRRGGALLRWVLWTDLRLLSLGRTGAYKPLAYRHTFVCLMLVVEPTSPVRALNKSLFKTKKQG